MYSSCKKSIVSSYTQFNFLLLPIILILFSANNLLAQAPGNALSFNGTTQSVPVNTTLGNFGTGDFTLEAWFRTSVAGPGTIVSKRVSCGSTNIVSIIVATSVLKLEIAGSSAGQYTAIVGNTNVADGKWHHVAAQRSGSVIKLFLDGVPDASDVSVVGGPTLSNSANFVIGSTPSCGYLFNGSIDEVRVYNIALTQANIQADMFSTSSSVPASLQAYYNFDASSGSVLTDQTANGNNGTLLNTPTWVESYAMVVPTATAATSSTFFGFTANWTAPTVGTVTNYLLDVSSTPTFSSFVSGYNGLSVSGTSQVVTGGLISNYNYYYRVRADKTSVTGQGGYSPVISVITTPPPGNALDFDGIDDIVTIPTMPMTNIANFTIEAWVYPKTFTNTQTIFTYGYGDNSTGNGIGLLVDASGGLLLNYPVTGTVVNTGVTLPNANRWYHVAVTRTGGVTTVYLNGTLAPTTASNTPNTPTAFYLGGYNGVGFFNGRIDEFRFYNTALNATQLQADMFSTSSVLPANLVTYYNFDNGAAGATNTGLTTLADRTGNANNGTLTNFALTASSSNWVESYAMVVPTATAGTSITTTGFTANWTAPAVGAVNTYSLDVSTSSTFSSFVSGYNGLALGGTSQAVTGLAPNTNYYYRVRADKTSVTGQGGYSTTITTKTLMIPPGNALDFDGSNDNVTVSTMPMTNIANFTMEGWVYPKTFTTNQTLFTYGYGDASTGNGIGLMVDATGQLILNFPTAGGVVSTGATLSNTNRWYHVAVTRTGGVTRVYLNGVLATTTSSFSPATPTAFYLGGYNGILYFNGRMDEFRMYNTALTATQILAEMFTTASTLPANLVAHYNFDNGVASANNAGVTTLNDISGNNRTGTLNNFALTGSTSNWVESYAMVVPTATAATSITSSGFTANWTAPAIGTVTNYLLDVSTSSTFSSFVSGYNGLVVNGTSQAVTGLNPNTNYYYRVRADKTSVTGQGGYSSTISTTTLPLTPPGNGLHFDGANDYVTVPYNASQNVTTELSIEAWIKPSGGGNIVTKQSYGYGFGVESDGRLWFWDQGSQASAIHSPVGSVTMNKWQHVAVTVQDVGATLTIYFYVNGVAYGPYTSSQAQINNGTSKTLDIGIQDRGGCSCNYFIGTMDELRIWNTVRTQAQLQANMSNTISGSSAGLITYYNFDNGTAGGSNSGVTSLTDQTANANNGTLTNFALTGSTSNWVESYAMVVPTATAATSITTTGFTANWTAPTVGTVTNYLLDVSTNATFSSFVSGYNGLSVAGTSQVVTGLSSGANYYYRVRADKTSVTGQGGYSSTVTTKTLMIPPGNALDFDGIDDIVTIPTMPMTNIANFTMEAWVYPKTFTTYQTIFTYGYGDNATGNGIGLWVDASGGLLLNFPGTVVNTGAIMPSANRWYHVAVTRTGGVTSVYLNGSLASTASNTPTTPTAFYLGAYNGITFFNGRMDEFRFYNTALNATQLQADMFSTSSVLPANLVTYYNFDNGVAGSTNTGITTLADQTSNANNGTLNNFTLTGSSSNWVESYAMVVPIATPATNISTSGFTANWIAPTIGTVTNYLLDVSGSPTFSSFVSGYNGLSVSGTSQPVTGLTGGTYYYRVRADKTSVTGQGGNSNTIVQAISYAPPGNALHFDGTNDNVTFASSITNLNKANFTIEAWIKTTAVSCGIVNCANSNTSWETGEKVFYLNASGMPTFVGWGNDYINSNVAVNDNKWHHVAVVWSYSGSGTSGTPKMYVDGVDRTASSNYAANNDNLGFFKLGMPNYFGGEAPNYFSGTMDEVRIWNTARTQAEIQANMLSTISGSTSGLVAYYNFDNGIAGGTNTGVTSLVDQTSNANTGTLTNFALTGSTSNWIASTAWNTWTGATSADYATATNWQLGTVPTSADNIVIPTGASNLPVTVSSAQAFYNAQVQASAALTNTSTLSIAGNLFNSGTITSTAGTIAYTGSSAQTVNANTFASNTVQGLTINNTTGVTLAGALTVTGVLTPTAGTLTTGNFLTLASSATGTARVAAGTGSYISGNTTVQRYIPGGKRAFRFLSHPFNSSLALSSLTDNIDITGSGGSPLTTTVTNAPSAFAYDNSIGNSSLASDPGWTPLTASSVFNAKAGYRILIRGSKGQVGSLTGGTYTPDPVTLDWVGVLNQGSQTVTLTNNGANRDFSLLGNPFASPIDLSLTTRGSNINANFYVWNPNLSTNGAYQANSFGASYILASGAAFFTQAAANTNNAITFPESAKVSGTPSASLFRNTSTDEVLTLQVNDNNGNYADKLQFFFNGAPYTANYDMLWDAMKLNNPDVNCYSFSDDSKKLAIDRRPLSNQPILLGLTANLAGNYQFVVNDLPNSSYEFYLKDKFLNTETKLVLNATVAFAVTTDPASQGNARFEIVTKANSALATTFVKVAAAQKANGIEVTWNTANETNINNYIVEESADGINFSYATSIKAKNASSNAYTWFDDVVNNGNNYYRIIAVENNGMMKYSSIVKVKLGAKATGLLVYPNPAKAGNNLHLQINNAYKGNYLVKIFNNNGQEINKLNLNVVADNFTTNLQLGLLPAGKYNLLVTMPNGDTSIKNIVVE